VLKSNENYSLKLCIELLLRNSGKTSISSYLIWTQSNHFFVEGIAVIVVIVLHLTDKNIWMRINLKMIVNWNNNQNIWSTIKGWEKRQKNQSLN
jgi:hypothetical protein